MILKILTWSHEERRNILSNKSQTSRFLIFGKLLQTPLRELMRYVLDLVYDSVRCWNMIESDWNSDGRTIIVQRLSCCSANRTGEDDEVLRPGSVPSYIYITNGTPEAQMHSPPRAPSAAWNPPIPANKSTNLNVIIEPYGMELTNTLATHLETCRFKGWSNSPSIRTLFRQCFKFSLPPPSHSQITRLNLQLLQK